VSLDFTIIRKGTSLKGLNNYHKFRILQDYMHLQLKEAYMQAIRSFLFFGLLVISSMLNEVAASEDVVLVLPSFTVDATLGAANSGFIVHCTDTSLNIDETCGTTVTYDWALDNGVQGTDWIFVEGTSSTTQDIAIEFFSQGCYSITVTVTDCINTAESLATEITVAGPPEIIVEDFTAVSTCSNGLAEAFWQLAPNNNNNVEFTVLIDGDIASPLLVANLPSLSFCSTPGTILHTSIISAGVLTAGNHTLTFTAIGDISTTPVVVTVDFDVFEAPTLSVTADQAAYCSNSLATVTADINFGLPPYLLDWSIDGLTQNIETVTGNSSQFNFDLTGIAGNTTNILVSLIDLNGCEAFVNIPIEVYDDVVFSLTTVPTCENSPAEFTATGNATQYWWPTPPFSVVNPVLAVGGNDTESAVMTDGNSVVVNGEIVYTGTSDGDLTCTTTEVIDAIVQPNPVLNNSPINGTMFCANDTPEFTVSGADSYTFSPAPLSSVGGTATYPTGLASPLTGTVTGDIDYSGLVCSSSLLFNYEILEIPDVNLSVDDAILCGVNDDVTVSTGGMDPVIYSFQWWLNGLPIPGGNNNAIVVPFIYPADAGVNDIACQVIHSNGCVGGSVIQVELLEGAELTLTTPAICEGEPFYIETATNGVVTWSANGSTPYADGFFYDPVSDGNVYVATSTFTSNSILLGGPFDCTVSAPATVDMRDNPILDFTFSGTPCTGENVQVDISGAENYSWTSTPTESSSSVNPDLINIDLNTLSLAYTDIIPGIIDVDATGSITYNVLADANPLTCSTFESFTANINSNTSFELDGPIDICEGECINLSVNWDDAPGGASFSYDWYLDGIMYSNGATFNHCPTFAVGTSEVTLVVEAGNACQATETVFVSTSEMPIVTIASDVNEGCSPLTVNFTSTDQFASVTAWNFDNGTSATGVNSAQMIFDCLDYDSGDCIFQVSFTAISPTNPNCTATAIEPVTVHPIPLSEFFLSETVVCFEAGSDAIIIANNISSEILGQSCAGGGPSPYNWTLFPTGSADCTELVGEIPNLVANGSGTFSIGLEVIDAFGCSSQSFEDFLVAEAPVPEINFLQTSVCLPTQIEIHNTTTGAASFNLDIPGFVIPNNFSSPFILDVEFPGVYEAEFTVTSIDGCSVTLDIDEAFEAWYPPYADFTTDPVYIDVLDPIVNFVNLSQGGTEYIWSFGDSDGSSEINPEHEYYMAGEYQVQLHVTNEYGCTDVSTQTIRVNNILQVFVPNTFTPNNDGNNDAWAPVVTAQELIAQYECWVFDRWGKRVFFSTTPGEKWVGDNKVDGAGTHYVSSTEAFTWRIEIKMVDGLGARTHTGHVFLVR
jgi:gliding motility-associated-like protein